ncbi:MAG TPA: STAS domain-containing protein [Acidimicrobiales bacterium]|nr:STAS domain-containing protein [Acidimicrobiales bacterium]
MEIDRTAVPGYLDFDVSVSAAGDATIVEIRGDLDVYTAPRLRAVLLELADGPRKVVLDVAMSDFIDSTGLGVLVGGLKRFRQQGGDMVLRSPSATTTRLFEVTGVIKLFELVERTEV